MVLGADTRATSVWTALPATRVQRAAGTHCGGQELPEDPLSRAEHLVPLACTATATERAQLLRSAAPARHYIFTTLHAPGASKPEAYRESQGPAATVRYNTYVRDLARDVNATVFDAHAFTVNATTIDGTHYLHATNVVITQLLLNLVHAIHKQGDPVTQRI